ncbi:tetratricopeptide repeat protein [Oricola cellulosilytica]|nr:tetratricopeptide repeat protein [Oricola cellulosilytica]
MCSPRIARVIAAGLVVAFALGDALAESVSYGTAFERRVSNFGSRDALDAFVVESVREGQYDQALSTLEEILLTAPNDIDVRIALARVYHQLGSHDLAGVHLDEAALLTSSEAQAAEIARLRRLNARAQRGITARMAITLGGTYSDAELTVPAIPATDSTSLFAPFVIVDGEIVRKLDTASRDEVRFGGTVQYERALNDTDFDGDLDIFDAFAGKAQVTYSKGLPDIADTLRLDVSGYGLVQDHGGGRELQEFGTEAEISFRPTVESRIHAFAGYGWLGNSRNLFTDHRVRYGIAGDVRIVAGLAVGAHASGYRDWGSTSLSFAGSGTDFEAHGYEAGAFVSHLLHAFENGQSWIHRFGGRYSEERILDYASVTGPFPVTADLVDRKAWELYWDHTVQIATRAEFNFRLSYGQDEISDAGPFAGNRNGEFWGIRTGLTYRFN